MSNARALSRVVLLTAVAGCAHGGPRAASPAPAPVAADFRARPPSPGPPPALEAPVPVRVRLANGLTVLVFEKRGLPLVAASVVVKSGSASDPDGLSGLSGFVADLLRAGTATRSAAQIADDIETLGAHLGVSVAEDVTTISTAALTQNFGPAFDIVADVVQRSVFAADEIDRVRGRRLAALVEEQDDPESLADRALREVVLGNHPYGHTVLGVEAALARVGREDLVAFARRHVRPGNAAVVVVGDLGANEAIAAVETRFGGWSATPGDDGPQPPPPAPKPQPPEVVLLPRPGAPQSQLRIGHLGPARGSPDYYALVVMNEILGGMFNSRINMNLREAKGYTYGAYSYFDFPRAPGLFVAGTAVRTEVTGAAIREVLVEIQRARESDVTAEELDHAKNSLALSLPGRFETAGAVASTIGGQFLYDLPLDYYRLLPERVGAVRREDVRRAAVEHLIPEQLSIVVVGDPARVEADLRELGRGDVEVRPVTVPAGASGAP